jgi:hypothetical protein
MDQRRLSDWKTILYCDGERVVLDLSDAGPLIYPDTDWQKREERFARLKRSAPVIPFPEQPLNWGACAPQKSVAKLDMKKSYPSRDKNRF